METQENSKIRVLFICLGNICRSPMAEAVFAHKVKLAGLEEIIEADSAGTGDWHAGDPPHIGTRRILAKNQVAYTHLARQIDIGDFDDFDYIVTMDDANMRNVRRLGQGRAKLQAFLEYAPETGVTEVPDPYYTGDFEETYRLVSAAAEGLLAAIRHTHQI